MIRVSIIGSGNVAFHLISALQKAETIELVQVCARSKQNIKSIIASEKIVLFQVGGIIAIVFEFSKHSCSLL